MAEDTSMGIKITVTGDPYQQKLLGILGNKLFSIMVNPDDQNSALGATFFNATRSPATDDNPTESSEKSVNTNKMPNIQTEISPELYDENLTVYTPDPDSISLQTFVGLKNAISNSDPHDIISDNDGDIRNKFQLSAPDIGNITNHSPSTSINSVGSSLPDHVSNIRTTYNGVHLTVNDMIQEYENMINKDSISAPEKMQISISRSVDTDTFEQREKLESAVNVNDDHQSEFDKQMNDLIYQNAENDEKVLEASSKMKYFTIMKDIDIFDNVSDVLTIDDLVGIASIRSDDTELESVANSSVHSPITPFSPFPHIPSFSRCKSSDSSTKILAKGSGMECDEADSLRLIQKHLIQEWKSDLVYFDKCIHNDENNKIVMISSEGFSKGIYEWMVEITKGDIYQQEIGVVSCYDIQNFGIKPDGIKGSKAFGSRAVYGNELWTDTIYYGSWNSNGKKRCYRDLKDKHHIGWGSGDVIKVCLDLNSWRIKFWLNGVRVRKSLSLQQGKTYYPAIAFGGNCVYNVVSLF